MEVDKLRRTGCLVQPRFAEGPAADVRCEIARDEQAAVVVMATHGQGGIGRWLDSSVADAVMRRMPIPVLLASAACESTPTNTSGSWHLASLPRRQGRCRIDSNTVIRRLRSQRSRATKTLMRSRWQRTVLVGEHVWSSLASPRARSSSPISPSSCTHR
jgi:hypothetical protein